MNAQQLKNSILQEAIEGRLVPQDPNDEPASVLLDKIRKEKARLVKEGKLKKKDLEEIPISEEEKPFQIPDNWEWCKLGNVLRLKSGECIKISSLNSSSDYPVYGGNGINGTYDDYNVESDTLIIGRVGYYCGCVHKTNSKAWVTDNALIVSYIKDLFDVDYLRYALTSLNLSSTSNSTAQPVVSGKGIYPLLVPLPPLAEQHRIVAKIEELLPKVEEYGKAQEALDKLNSELPEKLKKSILQEAITGQLVPQDPNDEPASVLLDKIRKEKAKLVKEGKLKKKDLEEKSISDDEISFEIPESWEWVRFGTITINRDSERIPLSVDERSKLEKKYDYYGASGVIDKVDRFLFDKPLLLIGEDGANLINRSTPIAFIAKGKYWVNNHAHVLDYINGTLLQYMCWYINAISLVDYVTGTAQPKMNQEKMNSILVALPPLAEQHRIVAKIEELFAEIDKLKV